ncbi:hypothetical protein SteCoe_8764 [Stentor coeruleus]|uniref:Rubisco LSMT substrate-binding domain-containing protein n=1 Tax=Stentor coeruleus TaxID=5963 RepID=A0A1R2CJK6_9CILI|nr:hypothetical protein SteCoe_8764 [Stentor coeruleus]
MYKPFPGAEMLPIPDDVQAMYDWAASKGVKWPKIYYPVRFPPGYIGTIATDTIGPNETVVSAPNDCLLTTKVAYNSELKSIYDAHPNLFSEDAASYDDVVIGTFIIYEKSKGSKSEWAPFLAYQPRDPSNIQDWASEDVKELQDEDLIYDTEKSLESHVKLWNEWKSTLEKYPDKFTGEMLEYKEFTWAVRLIGTRTFGKFAPYTTFFPVGELLNHDNVETYYIYLGLGETADATQRYSGIVDDEDHDARIYQKNPSIELGNEGLAVINYLLNDASDERSFNKIKEKSAELDNEELKAYKKRRAYRPPGMDLTESSSKEIRQVTGPNETYEKGSEVYMSYGRNSNRQLLSVYGFSLKTNHFNFAILKTSVKSLLENPDLASKLEVQDFSAEVLVHFKLKEKVLAVNFLKVIRKLWWKNGQPIEAFFKPLILDNELRILTRAQELLLNYLNSFQTTYEEDVEMLKENLPLRKMFAVIYRSQVKEIIKNQIEYLEGALRFVTEYSLSKDVDRAEEVNSEGKVRNALKDYVAEFRS